MWYAVVCKDKQIEILSSLDLEALQTIVIFLCVCVFVCLLVLTVCVSARVSMKPFGKHQSFIWTCPADKHDFIITSQFPIKAYQKHMSSTCWLRSAMETFHFVLRMCGACVSAGGGVFIVQLTLAFFGLAAPYESNFRFVFILVFFFTVCMWWRDWKVAPVAKHFFFICKCVLHCQ